MTAPGTTAPVQAPATSPGAPGTEIPVDELRWVHRSMPRVDGVDKVTGTALFASDLSVPNMLHAKVVRSDVPHGVIAEIDVSAAEAMPGVEGVLTGRDLLALPQHRYGHIVRDHPPLALDKVRFAGEPVAAVIARDERIAAEAAALVRVDYEELPVVDRVEAAIAADAAIVHEQRYERGAFTGLDYESMGAPGEYKNICHHNQLTWGDVDAAFAAADRVFEHEYRFPLAYAYAMEPYVTIADYTPSGIIIHSSAQHPYMVRHDVAAMFGVAINQVDLRVPYVGGGYGSKSYTKIEPLTTACSWLVGRPVRLALSVEEAILTTRIQGASMRFRTAVDRDGHIIGRIVELLFDGGAYAENGPLGAHQAAERVIGAMPIPNVRVDSYLIYTNTAPSSSFRGYTATQATFASESQLDEIAQELGLDPLEMRLRNTAEPGDEFLPGARPLDGDVKANLRALASAMDWEAERAPDEGRGLAGMLLTGGAKPVSLSQVRVHADDSVTVFSGSTEMGQGSRTVMTQIAAEGLGVPPERIRIASHSTSGTPFDRSTGASRSTTLQGRALLEACRDVRSRIRGLLTEVAAVTEEAIVDEPGGFRVGDTEWSFGAVISAYFGVPECDVTGHGHVRQKGDLAVLPVFWESSCVGVRVEVDRETGVITWKDLAILADVGLAINPAMAEGQDLGGAVQGAGAALFEELDFTGGYLANGSLALYRVPRVADVPMDPTLLVAERRDGVGPFGAKGAGEGPIAAIGPAIANAVADATGVRIRALPLTPERVWRALNDAASAGATSTEESAS